MEHPEETYNGLMPDDPEQDVEQVADSLYDEEADDGSE